MEKRGFTENWRTAALLPRSWCVRKTRFLTVHFLCVKVTHMSAKSAYRSGNSSHSLLLVTLLCTLYVAWCCIGYSIGSVSDSEWLLVRVLTMALSVNNLRQVIYTHVPLSPSSIIWSSQGAGMSCCWEGNYRCYLFVYSAAECDHSRWVLHQHIVFVIVNSWFTSCLENQEMTTVGEMFLRKTFFWKLYFYATPVIDRLSWAVCCLF